MLLISQSKEKQQHVASIRNNLLSTFVCIDRPTAQYTAQNELAAEAASTATQPLLKPQLEGSDTSSEVQTKRLLLIKNHYGLKLKQKLKTYKTCSWIWGITLNSGVQSCFSWESVGCILDKNVLVFVNFGTNSRSTKKSLHSGDILYFTT